MKRVTCIGGFALLFIAVSLWGQRPRRSQRAPWFGETERGDATVHSARGLPPAGPAFPAQDEKALTEADQQLTHGNVDAAIESYREILIREPGSAEAYVGLVHAYLKHKDIDEARETANAGIQATDAPAIHVALGEVYFRQGNLNDAEQQWQSAIAKGDPNARAYFELSRLRAAESLPLQAKELLNKAHQLDSKDSSIQRQWLQSLSREDRIRFWQDRLGTATDEDDASRAKIAKRIDHLRSQQAEPQDACKLVTPVLSSSVSMHRVSNHKRIAHYDVSVALNGVRDELIFDTGGDGIVIGESLAQRAGIQEGRETSAGGIGDDEASNGHYGSVNSIKVGDLEFQDCRVKIVDDYSVPMADGVIGSNVFKAALVDIDFPKEKLRFEPLPAIAQTAMDDNGTEVGAARASEATPLVRAIAGEQAGRIPPDKGDYTKVYHFGNLLLVPTRVEDEAPRLFVIDTGAPTSPLSVKAAENFIDIFGPGRGTVQGLSGSVGRVYRTRELLLHFGNVEAEDKDAVAFDLSHISDGIGTEVSGIVGLSLLQSFEIRINYRDGLVEFQRK